MVMHTHAGKAEAPALVLRGVCKAFGGLRAIQDLSLAVHPGERKGIIGPNGAGKTTLFNLITGMLLPGEGRIELFGRDVSRWPSHRRAGLGMARTFQITNLFPKLTVLDNVLLAVQGLRPMKFAMWRPQSSYAGAHAKARALLESTGFWERRATEVRHLSHGEQRQIEVVLALACDPKLLLLDEPVAGLSISESKELAAFLNRLDPALTILMIEHDMDVAFSVVTSIAVLHSGTLVEEGSLEQIRRSERVRELYLGTA
jgi:branched-chain amino acid transport system ATP-binding protein